MRERRAEIMHGARDELMPFNVCFSDFLPDENADQDDTDCRKERDDPYRETWQGARGETASEIERDQCASDEGHKDAITESLFGDDMDIEELVFDDGICEGDIEQDRRIDAPSRIDEDIVLKKRRNNADGPA